METIKNISGKILEMRFRFVIGFLIGTILSIVLIMSFFIEVPKGNEVLFAEIRTCFTMAFGAFIQHVMKTPEKEKNSTPSERGISEPTP